MEKTAYNDPKDDQVTNDDTAVTNKDGNSNLENGAQGKTETPSTDKITPDDLGDHKPVNEEEAESSNKGQGPKVENL